MKNSTLISKIRLNSQKNCLFHYSQLIEKFRFKSKRSLMFFDIIKSHEVLDKETSIKMKLKCLKIDSILS